MKRTILTVTSLALMGSASASELGQQVEENVGESRATIKEFATTLQGELKAAMQEGGPTEGIGVCNEAAPRIAAKASDSYGGEVGRTSLKVRNADNAPDEWERQVLERFEKLADKGADPKKLDHFEVHRTEDGDREFRYMKAIPTQEACLTCHGENIPKSVQKTIDENYPEDEARGFEKGDIRGAFTLTRPL
ncbi:MAG: Tll0287-like domain-containing protein [Thiohalospira sp.]|uniref:Tll0287-like domain-containing protein n=1 Tax=Thiohalospira sp. TaxID=3080549 RepID=UPI00397EA93C